MYRYLCCYKTHMHTLYVYMHVFIISSGKGLGLQTNKRIGVGETNDFYKIYRSCTFGCLDCPF